MSEAPITYLDADRVRAKRQTAGQRNPYRTGYGARIPTTWLLHLDGKRWHRVYVMCYSNSGSAYIRTKDGRLFLGAYDPSVGVANRNA